MLQQHNHESDVSRQRSSQRDTDRQMLADVWQQSLYDDEGGVRDEANGYGAGLPGGQGLPAMPQPEEEEAEEEHEAGETFMVLYMSFSCMASASHLPSAARCLLHGRACLSCNTVK